MELSELKKNYENFVKKFGLPSFRELDESFEIHKIDRESDVLLRDIRKQMMEKIVNSLGFVEMLLTGNNAPRMYYNYLKSFGPQDKENLEKIYSTFSELIVSSLELEIEYNEKNEAELIKEILKKWNGFKKNFKEVMAGIKKPNALSAKKKERSYFG